MKISVKDCSVIKVPTKKAPEPETRVRFTVTLAADNGEPLMSIAGFTIDKDRRVRPPSTRIRFSGAPMQFIHLSPFLEQQLQGALETLPDVRSTLGPPPLRKPQEQAPRLATGEISVLADAE
jgi:hypothetical protein